MDKRTIQIEDYNGNTIGAMELDMSYDGNISIINLIGFDIADEDEDDIFGTDGKIRLQANNKAVCINGAEWEANEADYDEERLDNMIRDTLPDDDYFEMNHYFD